MNRTEDAGLGRLVATLTRPHEPAEMLREAAEVLGQRIGHRLFTVLLICANRADTVRVYSDNLDAYPVNRLKRMGVTPWGDEVIRAGETWIGRNDEDIAWAFPDHALIRSLGLASALSAPVVFDGKCLAVLNLQHEAGWYRPEHIPLAQQLAPLLIPDLMRLERAVDSGTAQA
ncbi:GAF domain-containing protein [Roseateles toxinivorans]|uniref:GAF domain-containing protein n=1 Tax=Roseateles toxinivorans TaxID=270368 RepID=A0A4R6QET9_9BURK|nr:GAF domain-containing protein [Roseateles toxinivorans]TDP61258.1 GAF domain-containing protein [Roseateles toxinivorans]